MNRRHLLTAGAVAAVAVPLATGARAQQPAMMADGTMDPTKAPVILAGTFAKVTSQLAQQRAQADAVRQFADLEVAEQTAVAQAFGVPADAPPQIPENKAPELEQLRAVDDASFDMMYVDGQITGHQELRRAVTDYLSGGNDPMAIGAALVAVTEIDTHLVMLNALRATMG